MSFRREGWSWGQSLGPHMLRSECPEKPSLGPRRMALPPRTPAGLGRLSWQREEACFAGPGLPWGPPLLGA